MYQGFSYPWEHSRTFGILNDVASLRSNPVSPILLLSANNPESLFCLFLFNFHLKSFDSVSSYYIHNQTPFRTLLLTSQRSSSPHPPLYLLIKTLNLCLFVQVTNNVLHFIEIGHNLVHSY